MLSLLRDSVWSLELNRVQAQAVLDSAAATTEITVIARYGEFDLLDERQGDMAVSDLLDLVG